MAHRDLHQRKIAVRDKDELSRSVLERELGEDQQDTRAVKPTSASSSSLVAGLRHLLDLFRRVPQPLLEQTRLFIKVRHHVRGCLLQSPFRIEAQWFIQMEGRGRASDLAYSRREKEPPKWESDNHFGGRLRRRQRAVVIRITGALPKSANTFAIYRNPAGPESF